MAEAEILWVIEKLDSFLIEKASDVDGNTMRKVERVRTDLRSILDFVADRKLEGGSIRLEHWISDVVEIAHDAHLLIHDRDPMRYFELSVLFRPICRALSETKKLIHSLGGAEGVNNPLITSLSPQEGDESVVGLEKDVETVLRESILCDRPGLSTLCIVGMAGIGKTTLARKVFDHASVVDRYELRVWVRVSGRPSNKELLMKLILEVRQDEDQPVLLKEMENADNGSLQRMLHQHLQGKQFIIVLDDIGEIPYFRSIFKALPNEAKKESRLLLTSQFHSIKYRVALNAHVSTLKMKLLDDDQSWQLFLKLLFFGNQEFPKKLERKGKEMLRRCDGLPLAIKEVATKLVIKRRGGSEWEELLESIDLSLTLATLESSYNRLPPQLKSCFLCLSFFKRGISIKREKLVHIWSAGQVAPHEEEDDKEQDLEEEVKFCLDSSMMSLRHVSYVADLLEGYKTTLTKLVDGSIIEVDRSKKQRIKCIRINATFHTLSSVKAEEEKVFGTLKNREGNPPSSWEPCHRAIYCSRDEFSLFTDHDACLISLFFRGGGYFDASEPYWKRFGQLRVLDFEGFGLKVLPETIGILTELRYLGLRDNYIQELPRSLAHLKNLEVLDIALNFMLEVPDIIWKIGSLRHLYMSDIICKKPLKIDSLKNLETLTYISVDNWIYEVSSLKKMTSLYKLGIEDVDENSDLSKLFASLADLRKLDCLILRGFSFRSLPSLHGLETLHHLTEIRLDGLITNLPCADIFPPNITHLSLINSCLDEDPMPELGKLYYLSYLKLKNAYTGQQMVIPEERFYNLEVLCVEELWQLRKIVDDKYRFGLAKLEIRNCPHLENIPENIIAFRTKEMKMLTTRKLAAKTRKLDCISKIKHVDIQP